MRLAVPVALAVLACVSIVATRPRPITSSSGNIERRPGGRDAVFGGPPGWSSTNNTTVELLTPFVAPGEQAMFRAHVRGGSFAEFVSADVRATNLRQVVNSERTPTPQFGSVRSAQDEDVFDFPVDIPRDASDVTPLELSMDVLSLRSTWNGSTWRRESETSNLQMRLDLRSRSSARALRVGVFTCALLWLIVGALGARDLFARRLRARFEGAIRRAWLLELGVGALFLLGSKYVVGRPLGWLTGNSADLALNLIAGASTVAVASFGRALVGRRRPHTLRAALTHAEAASPAYRTPAIDRRTLSRTDLVAALARSRELRVVERGEAIVLTWARRHRPADAFVQFALGEGRQRDLATVHFNDTELLLAAVMPAVDLVGPVYLELVYEREAFRYRIDRATRPEDVVLDFRRAQVDRMRLQDVREDLLRVLSSRASRLSQRSAPRR
ncbi:MAG: hypothetical protein U0271_26600 [Polyangiaceae bacterium]